MLYHLYPAAVIGNSKGESSTVLCLVAFLRSGDRQFGGRVVDGLASMVNGMLFLFSLCGQIVRTALVESTEKAVFAICASTYEARTEVRFMHRPF